MKVVIYGKPNCTFCEQAKMLCKTQGVDYEYKVVGADLTKEQLFELCGGPVKSVPQIFIQKDELFERIGGFTELKESFSNIHKGSLLNG